MPASAQGLALEQAYIGEVHDVWLRVVGLVRAEWDSIDQSALSVAFRRFIQTAAGTIELGQRQAQDVAREFVGAYVEAEAERAFRPASSGSGIVGTMRDERPVATGLSGVTGEVWRALQDGKSTADAMAVGRWFVSALASNAVADSALRELAHQAARAPRLFRGWTWVTAGASTCPACLDNQDNRVRPFSQPMRRHPGCDCQQVPAVTGARQAVARPTGRQIFAAMSPAEQAAIFRAGGAEKALAIREGRATLGDFATRARTSQGTILTEASGAAA